jgi:hypothetical protein
MNDARSCGLVVARPGRCVNQADDPLEGAFLVVIQTKGPSEVDSFLEGDASVAGPVGLERISE